MGVDPGTGLVDRTIAIGSLEGGAHGQVVDDRVRIGGQPGALVEVAELSGIAEAEVHRADFAGTEIGVSVVKVALDADAGIQAAVFMELGQLPDHVLAGLGGGRDRPMLGIRTQLAGEDHAGHGAAHVGILDAGALRQAQGGVDLAPVGQLVVPGPVNIDLEYDTGTEGFDDRMETELYTGGAADLFRWSRWRRWRSRRRYTACCTLCTLRS